MASEATNNLRELLHERAAKRCEACGGVVGGHELGCESDRRDQWRNEFAGDALAALVDQAMRECPLLSYGIGDERFKLRLALGAAFEEVDADRLIEWAARIDSEILTLEQFVEREESEDDDEQHRA